MPNNFRTERTIMKIYWWQGGLHAEPENAVETEALMVLLDAVKYERPPENDDPRTPRTPTGLGESEGSLDVGL